MFAHHLVPKTELVQHTEADGYRFYQLPNGDKFNSVTTVLKGYYQKDLSEWQNRIGKKRADHITKQSAVKGKQFHNVCEKYIMNNPDFNQGVMPATLGRFNLIKPYLDANVSAVYGIEQGLYSYKYNTAGQTDLMACWKGENAVIDYKTSRTLKEEHWIEDYFVQSTVYGLLANELYDLNITKIVIINVPEYQPINIIEKPLSQYHQLADQIFINERK